MRLKNDFITMTIGDMQMMVATGDEKDNFHGIVRCNLTAAFIIEQLKKETTREKIIEAMQEKYNVTLEDASRDVDDAIEKLSSIGAIIQ